MTPGHRQGTRQAGAVDSARLFWETDLTLVGPSWQVHNLSSTVWHKEHQGQ